MTTYELAVVLVAGVAMLVPAITWGVLWYVRRDRIFTTVDPGLLPEDPDAPTKRVYPGSVYSGEMPLRSSPPPGVSPGLAGVVVDGCADGRDIAAMVLDLVRRGWLQLTEVPGAEAARDWMITRVDQPLDATLDLSEVNLITNIAAPGMTALMSELRRKGDNRLGLAQLDLAREAVTRDWYPVTPAQPSDVPMAVFGLGGLLGIVVALIAVTPTSVCAGAVIVASAFLTSVIVRGNIPRTALGTAIRIQILGFRRYLDEAESYQFSYTDAAATFRDYLPWAVVFGFEQRWADTFAKLDVVADAADVHLAQDLRWFAGIRQPTDALPPTTEPVGQANLPRRLAFEYDIPESEGEAETILQAPPGGDVRSAAGDGARETPSPVSRAVSAARLAASDTGRGLAIMARAVGTTARGLGFRITGLIRGVGRRSEEQTVILPAVSPATPVRRPPAVPAAPLQAVAQPVPEQVADPEGTVILDRTAAVRQWVPRPSTRPVPLTSRRRPVMPAAAPPDVPAAPATPRRPPREQQPPIPVAIEQAIAASIGNPVGRPVAQPRPLPPWSEWLHEFDQAMSGDFVAHDPDTTEGGTVITGPERFDVLVHAPLWPDVARAARSDAEAG